MDKNEDVINRISDINEQIQVAKRVVYTATKNIKDLQEFEPLEQNKVTVDGVECFVNKDTIDHIIYYMIKDETYNKSRCNKIIKDLLAELPLLCYDNGSKKQLKNHTIDGTLESYCPYCGYSTKTYVGSDHDNDVSMKCCRCYRKFTRKITAKQSFKN